MTDNNQLREAAQTIIDTPTDALREIDPALRTALAQRLAALAQRQGEPAGWLYGNSFYAATDPRLTDYIREQSDALYTAHPASRPQGKPMADWHHPIGLTMRTDLAAHATAEQPAEPHGVATSKEPPRSLQAAPLPCPFCGSLVVVHLGHNMGCHQCGAEGPDADDRAEPNAIEVWNKRAILAATAPAPVAATQASDELERQRIAMGQERTPAYGDALALCRRLEAAAAAAPVAEVLTDAQIFAIRDETMKTRALFDSVAFARAIIAAMSAAPPAGLGEKS